MGGTRTQVVWQLKKVDFFLKNVYLYKIRTGMLWRSDLKYYNTENGFTIDVISRDILDNFTLFL